MPTHVHTHTHTHVHTTHSYTFSHNTHKYTQVQQGLYILPLHSPHHQMYPHHQLRSMAVNVTVTLKGMICEDVFLPMLYAEITSITSSICMYSMYIKYILSVLNFKFVICFRFLQFKHNSYYNYIFHFDFQYEMLVIIYS